MAGGDLVGSSENSHRDWWHAQLLHTSRGDRLTSVWKVPSAGVLRSPVWMLQIMLLPGSRLILENPDSSFIVFYLRARVGAVVAGSIFLQLRVVPGTLAVIWTWHSWTVFYALHSPEKGLK